MALQVKPLQSFGTLDTGEPIQLNGPLPVTNNPGPPMQVNIPQPQPNVPQAGSIGSPTAYQLTNIPPPPPGQEPWDTYDTPPSKQPGNNPLKNFASRAYNDIKPAVVDMGKGIYRLNPVVNEWNLGKTAAGILTGNKQATQHAEKHLKDSYDTAVSVAQSVPRAVMQARDSFSEATGGNGGKQQLSNFQPQPGWQQDVFGKQPIQSFQDMYQNIRDAAGKNGGTQNAIIQTGMAALMDALAVKGGVDLAEGAAARVPGAVDAVKNAGAKTGSAIQTAVDNRTPLNEGGFLAGPKATGFQAAQDAGKTFTGPDGKPRFEISDADSTVNKVAPDGKNFQIHGTYNLSDLLNHPSLYDQYPFLKNLPVTLRDNAHMGANTLGSFDPETHGMELNLEGLNNYGKYSDKFGGSGREAVRGTMLHEIQHAIQHEEGFAKGGGPSHFTPERMDMLNNRLESIHQRVRQLVGDSSQGPLQVPMKGSDLDKQVTRLMNAYDRYDKEYVGLAKGGVSKYTFDHYQRLGGEAESRAVEDRMNLPQSMIDDPKTWGSFYDSLDVPKRSLINNTKDEAMGNVSKETTPTLKDSFDRGAELAPDTAAAAKTLAYYYDKLPTAVKSGVELLRGVKGTSAIFSRLGSRLDEAMNREFTPEELKAARDNLEGASSPEGLTPRVVALTHMMRELNERGYKVLDRNQTTKIGRVAKYATRIANFTNRPGQEPQSHLENVKNLFDVQSRFGRHRQIGKYVGSDGEVRYGTKADAGLHSENGTLKDGSGKVFQPAEVSTKELEDNGYDYEKNYGKIANIYHTSVGRQKAAQDAIDELLRDPEHYGLQEEPSKGLVRIGGNAPDALKGYWAPRKLANAIEEELGAPRSPTMLGRAWRGLVHSTIQTIVFNPFFHGRNLNQLAGMAVGKGLGNKGLFGTSVLKKAYLDVMRMSGDEREALTQHYLDAKGHIEDYGSGHSTVLSNALDKVGMPHINKATAGAMSKIDTFIRLSVFHALVKHGVKDTMATKIIDDFMGDGHAGNLISQNVGLFWHYLRTRVRVMSSLVQHPIENRGATLAFAEQAAALYGTTKAFQQWTGNPNASLGHPGLFGLTNEANNLAHGNVRAVASTGLNPIVTATLNQLYGKDLFTGKAIHNDLHSRLADAESTLFAPDQYIGKVNSGKATPAEEGLRALTGVTLSHTKGAPAIPNTNNPLASIINAKGAKAVPDEGKPGDKGFIHDPTGIRQAENYFGAVNRESNAIDPNDTYGQTTLAKVLARSHDPNNGKTIALGVNEQKSNAHDLYSSDSALHAFINIEKSQAGHNPIFDHSFQDIKEYERYESLDDGDPNRKVLEQKNPQLMQMFREEGQYYNGIAKRESNDELPSDYVPFPNISNQQEAKLQQYSILSGNKASLSADQQTQLTNLQNDPELQAAFTLMDIYTNDRRQVAGLQPIPYPVAQSPEVEAGWKAYNALPQHNGPKGGSPDRALWIKNNQDLYNQMQAAAAQETLFSVEEQGAIAYQGGTAGPNFLKDIKNLGQYDIAKTTDASGKPSYSLDPAAAYALAQAGTSTAKGFTPFTKSSSSSSAASFKAQRTAKAAAKTEKIAMAQGAAEARQQMEKYRPKVKRARIKKTPGIRHVGPYVVGTPQGGKAHVAKVRVKKSSSSGKVARLKV